jgi:hypothetical protein
MGSGGRGSAHRPAQRGAVPDPVILELRFRPPEEGGDPAVDDRRYRRRHAGRFSPPAQRLDLQGRSVLWRRRAGRARVHVLLRVWLHDRGQAFAPGLCDPRSYRPRSRVARICRRATWRVRAVRLADAVLVLSFVAEAEPGYAQINAP